MSNPLNLASRPFLNRRPVIRFRVLMWTLAAALVAVNAVALRGNLRDSTELRERLSAQRGEIDAERGRVLRLRNRLAALDPERQNARVRFLNGRIDERTFPWGRLFDQLGELLPRRVRLRSLNPEVGRRPESPEDAAYQPPVRLAINGAAGSDEELYELMDAFWSHPAFEDPRLAREAASESGEVQFALTVVYRPDLDVGAEIGVADDGSAASEAAEAE